MFTQAGGVVIVVTVENISLGLSRQHVVSTVMQNEPCHEKSNRKAMNRNWSNQNTNPALKTKAGNK